MGVEGTEPDAAELQRALARDAGTRPSIRVAAREALAAVLGEGRERDTTQRRFWRAMKRLRAEDGAAR